MNRWIISIILILCVLGCRKSEPKQTIVPLEEPPRPATKAISTTENEAVFALSEVSIIGNDPYHGKVGARIQIGNQPETGLKSRPPVKSAKALYGKHTLQAAGPTSPTQELWLCLDESGGTGAGYDRVYADTNFDGDLANDRPAGIQQKIDDEIEARVYFETVTVSNRALVPVLDLSVEDRPLFSLLPATLRKGEIDLGGCRYEATLSAGGAGWGSYDSREAGLKLIPINMDDAYAPHRDTHEIEAVRSCGGKSYVFSASAAGDRLTVRKYTVDPGAPRMAPGSNGKK